MHVSVCRSQAEFIEFTDFDILMIWSCNACWCNYNGCGIDDCECDCMEPMKTEAYLRFGEALVVPNELKAHIAA